MISPHFGDATQTWRLTGQQTRIRQDLQRLSTEVTTGKATDIASHLNGDLNYLGALSADRSQVTAYLALTQTAANRLHVVQTTLETIQTTSAAVSSQMLQSQIGPAMTTALTQEAETRFATLIQQLNQSYAGQTLFAGTATDSPALAGADTILANLHAALGGDYSYLNVTTTLDAWFAPAGSFDTIGYLGAAEDAPPPQLGDGATAEVTLRADHDAMRDLLKGMALAAVASNAAPTVQADLLEFAGTVLLSAEAALGDSRATLGFSQERVAQRLTTLAAQSTSLEMAQSELIGVDPFAAAGALQAAETQLQTLYAVTARLSSLSLVNYL